MVWMNIKEHHYYRRDLCDHNHPHLSLSRRKTVVLVTHHVEMLRPEDHVVFIDKGKMKSEGTLSDLNKLDLLSSQRLPRHEDIKVHDDPVQALPALTEVHKASVTSLASTGTLFEENNKSTQNEKSSLEHYFSAGGCSASFIVLFFFLAQIFASLSDYWISFCINALLAYATKTFVGTTSILGILSLDFKANTPRLLRYSYCVIASPSVNMEETGYNVTWLSKAVKGLPFEVNRQFCLETFGVLIVGTMSISVVRSLMYFFGCIRASKVLHKNMFRSVLSAKMNFFYTTKSGNIMSRFSKDQGTVDEHLPIAIMDFLQVGLTVLGIMVLIPATNIWLILPTVALVIVFCAMRVIYVRTTKRLREIEGEARSPLFTTVASSLDGLVTIHARGKSEMVKNRFDGLQDFHTSAWYLYLAANRAFAFWLDMFCVIYNAAVTLSFVIFRNNLQVANVGLAITQCSGLAYTMEWSLRQSAEVENSLVSVQRIVDYSKLEQEDAFRSRKGGVKVIEGWPRRGAVNFSDVYMRYNRKQPWILKGINFNVLPGQKVGIVGRTGSGKSSITLALFRLVDYEGTIKIDGVDIRTLGLHDLRPRISVIPQDPCLFSGTIRSNLDPLGEFDDLRIWEALEKVEMSDFIREQKCGLSMVVKDQGENLSTGQKQLLCLARGILRCNKIVVLDEATANVDKKTEDIIQKTIRTHFQNTTVIVIAHRLHTVMESDVIIVVESGRIKQIGPPSELMKNTGGQFYALVNNEALHSRI